jgi:hypothetical protein
MRNSVLDRSLKRVERLRLNALRKGETGKAAVWERRANSRRRRLNPGRVKGEIDSVTKIPINLAPPVEVGIGISAGERSSTDSVLTQAGPASGPAAADP